MNREIPYITAMSEAKPPRPVVLCILDGWGERNEPDHNAIKLAHTPVWDGLKVRCPSARLDAAAHEVGLPAGQMGNSEVGHMNFGAGRVVLQDLARIDRAIERGQLAKKPAIQRLVERLRASGGACHLMGLVSPGGVHSHQDQIAELARILCGNAVPVWLHAFLDGRDTPPMSARDHLARFLAGLDGLSGLQVATVSGRYYAMDRDRRWPRTRLAYEALVDANGERAPEPLAAVERSYGRQVTDEFVRPTVIDGYAGMADGDGLVMANFRADRVRQTLSALLDPAFDGFQRQHPPRFAAAVGMTAYSAALDRLLDILFRPAPPRQVLGQVVAAAGRKQLRIAETEKYAHVTFFLNGGRERQFRGERRILVPSPKIATYDLKPEMSALEVTDRLVEEIAGGSFDLIVVNYANTDMVGHSGDLAAAIKAVEAVDRCLGRLEAAVRLAGGALIITADHGNAEQMRDPATGEPHTAHTLNPVPLILVNAPPSVTALADGRLADVAPTVLALMGLPRPAEMTGRSLLIEGGCEASHDAARRRAIA
ncbi:MAG: 2,3-bisphosphoglycerate-independent phosphoglycerate mutase [Kiloniellales bacterium]